MIIVNKVIIPPVDQLLKLFGEILESGIITNNGPFVKRFENELKVATNADHVLCMSNGTVALQLAINAMHIKGEIITTPFTFVASSSCILLEGCTPVFADIDPETLCIDTKSIEQKINDKTVGILPVHIYGNVCDVEGIATIADQYQLKTIYDGAQCFGSTYNGKSALTFGDATSLSLHAYKIISSIEGGAIFCKDKNVADELFRIRYFGKDIDNEVVQLGINGKMSEINAAYGLVSLDLAKFEISRRKEIYNIYQSELSGIESLRFMKIDEKVKLNYAYFPLIFPSEEDLLRITKIGLQKGIELRRYFYPALNTMEFLGCDPNQTPIAYDISKRIVCLPLYSSLIPEEIERIISFIKENC